MSRVIEQFKISVSIPKGIDRDNVRDYIQDAVASMGGSHHPDSPFFDLQMKDVIVSDLRVRNND